MLGATAMTIACVNSFVEKTNRVSQTVEREIRLVEIIFEEKSATDAIRKRFGSDAIIKGRTLR